MRSLKTKHLGLACAISAVHTEISQAVTMKPSTRAAALTSFFEMGIPGIFGTSRPSVKQKVKCGLKDCNRTTTHNGGYCCAKHCQLDRQRKRSGNTTPK